MATHIKAARATGTGAADRPERQPFSGYYTASQPEPDNDLTRTGPGTPCGEYMRRYWQPIAILEELPPDNRPYALNVLGEELVLFKDLSGHWGLLHAHCAHRQASLEFGIVCDHGIRCCYHGWQFDVDGTLLYAGAEPENSPLFKRVRQGAYPVQEYKGILFAYMGPPDHKPDFPIYDTFTLPDVEAKPYSIDMPCNWLQIGENVVDPYHTVFLHTRVSGTQFSDAFAQLPHVEWFEMPSGSGLYLFNVRRVQDNLWIRVQEAIRPNFSQTGDIWQDPKTEKIFNRVGLSKWMTPMTDTTTKVIGWRWFGEHLDSSGKADWDSVGRNKIDFEGQTEQRTYEERQKRPGDYEAIASQGPITLHKKENLGMSDGGVALYRRLLRRNIQMLQDGEPLPEPVRNGDGTLATYSQDTVLRVPPANEDDKGKRVEIARNVARFVVESDTLAPAARTAEIRRRILEELGIPVSAGA
ncbi:MAG: aromatic ring-hydroxylating dioxygenase subunit alpha [Alphaproteobacteria bacterium]